MKILQRISALALIVLLSCSCGNDNDDQDLTGTWTFVSVNVTSCNDPSDNVLLDFETNNGCFIDDVIEICISGNLVIGSTGSLSLVITYSSQGSSETETSNGTITVNEDNSTTLCADGDCQEGTSSINDNTLTIVTQGEFGCMTTIIATRS